MFLKQTHFSRKNFKGLINDKNKQINIFQDLSDSCIHNFSFLITLSEWFHFEAF